MYSHLACVVSLLAVPGLCADPARIVGGKEVAIASYPYMASLQLLVNTTTYLHQCGATILSPKWLLTAAHCLGFIDHATGNTYSFKAQALRLVIGRSRISRSGSDNKKQLRNVSEVHSHPEFRFTQLGNDIGMLKVAEPMTFSQKVGVVKIPKKKDPLEDPKANGKCNVLGWGITIPLNKSSVVTDPASLLSPVLMMVEQSLSTMSYCRENIDKGRILSYHQICTYSNESKGTCAGDSGGPLMCNGEQWGVLSGSNGCGRPGSPNVFTRVDAHLGWIQHLMESPSSSKRTQSSSSRGYPSTAVIVILVFATALETLVA